MYKFKYKNYESCCFSLGLYPNGNFAIEIWGDEEGPICRVTVNPGVKIPDDCIAIKNYSENEGIVEFLQELDIIAEEPVTTISSGYVFIPVYKITENGIKILEI